MKRAIFLRFVVLCLVFLGSQAKAQMYFIPDTCFRAFLQTYYPTCMSASGDSIDGSCPQVLNATQINVSYKIIVNLKGIQAFQNLQTLICTNNYLTSLPSLPPFLTYLDCSYNYLDSLSILPSTLTFLNCNSNSFNSLTCIPALPPNLTVLSCVGAGLYNLPNLPSSLTYLDCSSNPGLYSLPSLPNNLKQLYCNSCNLSTLPSLPDSLIELECDRNLLTSLPSLPDSLSLLYCRTNKLTGLPFLPTGLKYISCVFNQIVSLPALNDSLISIDCSNNLLTSLPILKSSLKSLYCIRNQITNLPVLPSSLTSLLCYENQLTSLPALPSALTTLACNDNQLTSLPSLPSFLKNLNCSLNQLTNLPSLPSTLTYLNCESNIGLNCLPDLKNLTSLIIANTNIQCLPNYGKITSCIPPLNTFPLCGIFNTNACDMAWNINGNVFLDSDSNCIKTIADSVIPNQKIHLFQNGSLVQQTYSNLDGNFCFDTNGLSTYSTKVDTAGLPFSILCPFSATYTDILTSIDSVKSNRNFAAKCKGIDLAVTSIYGAGFRPASQRPLIIHAGDFSNNFGVRCAAGVSGSVQIILSGPCQYISATSGALLPTIINGDTLVYSISDFGSVDFNTAFGIEVLVDTIAVLGSQICVTVEISTSANEIDTTNNYLSQCFNIVNSYDPNDKSVYPTYLKPGVDNWLTYNINFQNTGNAEAIDIYITDTLDANLDWSSFELLSYSHFPLVQLYNTGIIKFNYPKIYLPDSTNNEPESHGYVQFKIKALDSLAIGSVVSNTANIYFDFNPPVITNTVSTLVADCQLPTTVQSITICNEDSYQFNGTDYKRTGTFYQHYLTTSGCDSTVMLDLTVLPKSFLNFLSICEGTIFDFNGQQLTNAGVYIDTLTNVLGCDSIVTINLSVIPAQININDNFCQGSSYNFNNQQLTSAGVYSDTLLNVLGCDSIIELTLVMNATYNDTITATICNYEQYAFNNLQLNQSGSYQALYTTINGCDSVEVLNLSVLPDISNAITQNNAQLSTSGVGSSYNWIDCTTGLTVPNEIASVFNPPAAGSYSAVVYYGNCIDTSACFQFVTTGVAEFNSALVNINPNPFQEELTITRKDNRKETLEVYNLLGEQILQREIQEKKTTLSTQTWPAGIYIVKVIGDRDVITTRVVKN